MTIENIYELFIEAGGKISTDTRIIQEGSIFFALRGEFFDGNLFAGEALDKGATIAIVDDPSEKRDDRFILVEDVLTTLQDLASYHVHQMGIPVICLTGSNGKTTTKELIHAILKHRFNVIATRGNYNNHIGVPLTLLRITGKTEIAVVELGANHKGEIERLCNIACPNYGLITNIGRAHIDGFGSLEGIISGKTELYRYLDHQQGTVFYHADNDILNEQVANLSVKSISYGTKASPDVQGGLMNTYPYIKLKVVSEKYNQELVEISSYLVGSYNYENILAAICIGYHFGITKQQVKEAVENYIPSNNRSQYLKTEKNEVIVDCYNANPTSMKAAITGFAEDPARDKLLVLGDMFELGDTSQGEHQEILNYAETIKNMGILTAGSFFKACDSSRALQFNGVESLRIYLKENPPLSRKILLKGSRGMKLETVLNYL